LYSNNTIKAGPGLNTVDFCLFCNKIKLKNLLQKFCLEELCYEIFEMRNLLLTNERYFATTCILTDIFHAGACNYASFNEILPEISQI
jgi:hypothetical protein